MAMPQFSPILQSKDETLNRVQQEIARRLNPVLAKTLGELVPVPESATSAGVPGMFAVESGFLYVCVDVNQWQRVALAGW